jgi:MFS superfamily sulfate permease-like transporter
MSSFFKTWRDDIPAGLVVFLVAVPLCLGIALASEAPPFAGLIAGIVGGIVVGSLSGSSIGVSGPAAGLTAIVASAIHDLGTFELFLAAVVIAGVIQLILGVLRAGFISHYFPNVVIKGMLAAIGIIIILKQLPHAVGYDKDPEGDENFFQIDGENTFSEVVKGIENITTPSAILITLISIGILLLWERKFIQKTVLRLVPGALLVVVVGIILTLAFQGTSWELISEHRVDVGVSDKSFAELFTFPDFSQWNNPKFYIIAVTMAVVASIETLLSVDASDKLDPERRITPGNRELLAQGAGNIVSGMIGGLPVTQVVVRTSANVNSGGRSKLSTIFHGILIAAAVATISGLMNYIPYASLAAVLLMVGYKLAKPKIIIGILKEGWLQFIPFATTIIGVVRFDLLTGVGLGLGVSIIIAIIQRLRLSNIEKTKVKLKKQEIVGHYQIEMPDFASFAKKSAVIKVLKKVPDNSNVQIDLSNVQILSPDIEETIDEFRGTAKTKNISIDVIPPVQETT